MGLFSRSRSSRSAIDIETLANTNANTPTDPSSSPASSMRKTKSRASSTTSSTSSSKPCKSLEPLDTESLIANPHKTEKAQKYNSHDQHMMDCWKQANSGHYRQGQDSGSPAVFWSWS